jgi:hypothetical protein
MMAKRTCASPIRSRLSRQSLSDVIARGASGQVRVPHGCEKFCRRSHEPAPLRTSGRAASGPNRANRPSRRYLPARPQRWQSMRTTLRGNSPSEREWSWCSRARSRCSRRTSRPRDRRLSDRHCLANVDNRDNIDVVPEVELRDKRVDDLRVVGLDQAVAGGPREVLHKSLDTQGIRPAATALL